VIKVEKKEKCYKLNFKRERGSPWRTGAPKKTLAQCLQRGGEVLFGGKVKNSLEAPHCFGEAMREGEHYLRGKVPSRGEIPYSFLF